MPLKNTLSPEMYRGPGEEVDTRVPVPGGGCGYRDPITVSAGDDRGLPGAEADGIAAETAGAGDRREDLLGDVQGVTAPPIEVVVVLVVAEQDCVDGPELIETDRGILGLGRADARSKAVMLARGIEGWICEQSDSTNLDQGGRAADIGELAAKPHGGIVPSSSSRCQTPRISEGRAAADRPAAQAGRCHTPQSGIPARPGPRGGWGCCSSPLRS